MPRRSRSVPAELPEIAPVLLVRPSFVEVEGTRREPLLLAGLRARGRALRRLHARAIHVDLAAVHGLGRERARLEEARRPEPLVDADFLEVHQGIRGSV